MMLILQTDGRPTMTLAEVATLLNMQTKSLLNRIYAKRTPFPMFQLEGGAEWYAHVRDVATYIDETRDAAAKEFAAAAA